MPKKLLKEPVKSTWSAPKRLKVELEDKLLTRRNSPRVWKSPSKICKVTKGDHVFIEISRVKHPWTDEIFITSVCQCGKKKISSQPA